jgi:uncharacterized protein
VTESADFAAWLRGMLAALSGRAESDVPCGTCTACCRSAQFVHIGPDEVDTLAHVPGELLFPAPRMPRGHKVLGYDERGWCPMLRASSDRGDTRPTCSIYEHRPRACRVYDCRVFAAAGIEPDQPAVAGRTRDWTFSGGADEHRAVRAAAAFLAAHPELIPTDGPTAQRAIAAIELHDLFLHEDQPTTDVVRWRLLAVVDRP